MGCGGRGSVLRATGLQGGLRSVSDQQHADERCCCVRRSRVVLTPRRWCQVRGVASALPGLDKTISASDGGKRARSPGRARRKPLKPLRAGMPGDSGVLVVTRVLSTATSAHEAAGAAAIRHSPRPPWARRILAQLGRIAPREGSRMRDSINVIASAAKQSTLSLRRNGLLRGACHRARIRATRWLCAEHDRQLGGESPLSSLMVAKD